MRKNIVISIQIAILGSYLFATNLLAAVINVTPLKSAPTLDGSDSDWSAVSAATLPLKNDKPDGRSNVESISIKAGVFGDKVYFLLQWKDDSEDNQHKPYTWDAAKNKYIKGTQQEDRVALQFVMSGDYDVNWLSGNTFTADTWHWKAARSNPAGIAQDKRTIIGKVAAKKAFKGTAADGSTIYIKRPSDAGDKLYKTQRYKKKESDVMPKYIVNKNPTGSIADVKAKAIWGNGMWTLELSRKLNTGNSDDVVFQSGRALKGGIAVFNHSGNDDHNHSETINFQF